ncbi:hypothetical protein PR048_014192 [Dryococelus australis]|uniref:Uncharacterized protein n=1 Tax=Dryococelus australis TaxID=614101 RepID=A0ABQ9HDR8_9NEOP|nr:hypothetical protein PR048_014192 [Dryococelus australis]
MDQRLNERAEETTSDTVRLNSHLRKTWFALMSGECCDLCATAAVIEVVFQLPLFVSEMVINGLEALHPVAGQEVSCVTCNAFCADQGPGGIPLHRRAMELCVEKEKGGGGDEMREQAGNKSTASLAITSFLPRDRMLVPISTREFSSSLPVTHVKFAHSDFSVIGLTVSKVGEGKKRQLINEPPSIPTVDHTTPPPTTANLVQSPGPGHRIFASGNRAGRFRWSVGFLGDLPFPSPLHSGAAPYSLQSPSSGLKTSLRKNTQRACKCIPYAGIFHNTSFTAGFDDLPVPVKDFTRSRVSAPVVPAHCRRGNSIRISVPVLALRGNDLSSPPPPSTPTNFRNITYCSALIKVAAWLKEDMRISSLVAPARKALNWRR